MGVGRVDKRHEVPVMNMSFKGVEFAHRKWRALSARKDCHSGEEEATENFWGNN